MAVYLDASALVKLIVTEAESAALVEFLRDRPERVSALIVRTEVARAVRRYRPRLVAPAVRMLDGVQLVDVLTTTVEQAGELDPVELSSLDAIHVATAYAVRSDLEAVVTYDTKMTAAARLLGLRVEQPA